MAGGKPLRPLPRKPFSNRRIKALRSICTFLTSVFVCYWVGVKFGPLPALLFLAFLWFAGALNLLEYLVKHVAVTGDEADYNDLFRRADIMQQPNVQKFSDKGENAWLSYGFSCMQGWRRTMEDDHVTILSEDGGFFGVFDGHSGSNVAKFCGGNIFDFVSKTAAFEEKNYTKAIYDGFIAIDKHLHTNYSNEKSGCTAAVLLVKEDDLYCGNAGDSRAILCRDGEPVPLSNDHKPFLPQEQSRIERAGGYVWNRRVNGALALSRAIGDFGFKCNTQVAWDQQAVTSAPEVRFSRLNRDRDEFAVVACDGIWDVLSNEQVVEFVRERLQRRVPLDHIAEGLLERCLSPQPFGLGCDNMSVVIIQFKRMNRVLSPLKNIQENQGRTSVTSSLSADMHSTVSDYTEEKNKKKIIGEEEKEVEGGQAKKSLIYEISPANNSNNISSSSDSTIIESNENNNYVIKQPQQMSAIDHFSQSVGNSTGNVKLATLPRSSSSPPTYNLSNSTTNINVNSFSVEDWTPEIKEKKE